MVNFVLNFFTFTFTLLTKHWKTQFNFFTYTFTLQANTRNGNYTNLNFPLQFTFPILISHLHLFLPLPSNQTGPS